MIVSALLLAMLLVPLVADASAGSNYLPPPDPGPNPACPPDMRLVQGQHYDEIERLCLVEKANRCWAFEPLVTAAHGPGLTLRFCMDRFEAPNREGVRPYVMQDLYEAKRWCEDHGRRLCREEEFETACEGALVEPFFYGWQVDPGICNTNKRWIAFDGKALAAGGETARRETERLWQGSTSGGFPRCRTRDGIYDLIGNVEEWVAAREGRRFPGALMGGFWAKPWVGCRGTNDAHEPSFRFYEVGWRCCADAAR